MVIAVLSGSLLLYSDMLDYARSITAGIIAWGILRRIRKGDVLDYDYGTGKLESLGGVIGSLLFMLGLLGMAGFTLNRIFHPIELQATFTALGALSQFIGLLISAWLWWRNWKLARQASTPPDRDGMACKTGGHLEQSGSHAFQKPLPAVAESRL